MAFLLKQIIIFKKYTMKKSMKCFLIFIILTVISGNIVAGNIDSLKLELKNAKNDSIRCLILNNLIETEVTNAVWSQYNEQLKVICEKKLKTSGLNKFYKKYLSACYYNLGELADDEGNVEDALNNLNISLKLSEEIKDREAIANSYNFIGIIYSNQGELKKALEYYYKSLFFFEFIHDKKGMSRTLTNIAIIYENQGDIHKALKYYHKSLKLKEEINDKAGIATSFNNIGIVHSNQGDKTKALEYYTKSLKIRKEINNKKGVASSLNNIGTVYGDMGKPLKALDYYGKSLKLREEIGDLNGIATSLNNIGCSYEDLDSLGKALEYYNHSLEIYERINDKEGIADVLKDITDVYFKQNKFTVAKQYALRSLKISNELGYPLNIKSTSNILSKIYSKTSNWKDAYEMQLLFIQMTDSVSNESNLKTSIQKGFEYEYEKKALADSIRVFEEKKVIAAQLKQEKTQRFALYGGLILMLVFAGFMFNRFKVTQKQKHIIEEQKEIVDEKQKEITDSINYSKRIQTAILPDVNEIKKDLSDFFILYQPKDIVSGDFYYFNKVNDDIFIAAADCTGHGVPGAFMSLVGSKELKIANAMTNSPAQILKHLNNGVKDTLRQNHIDGTKDGMDIALVKINGTTVTYSAANRPLWILRNESSPIEEIKATKTAIGGFTENDFEFEEHEVILTKGDILYLFSDGFADQFGGEKQKKMTTKRFREFALSIKDKLMTDQKLELENYFKTWQGNTEQVDDLLVIGIRI